MPSLADYSLDGLSGVSQVNGLNAQSVVNTASAALKMPGGGIIAAATAVIKGSAGIASGTVTIDGSLDPVSTAAGSVGNWFQMTAPVNAVASVATPIFASGPVYWIRTRIAVVIVGGTVSTDLIGSGD